MCLADDDAAAAIGLMIWGWIRLRKVRLGITNVVVETEERLERVVEGRRRVVAVIIISNYQPADWDVQPPPSEGQIILNARGQR